jgi:predicted kinase
MVNCIVVLGAPRAGKDWVALLGSEVTGARVLGTDEERKKMVQAGIIPYQSRYEKKYMQMVYDELIVEAKDILVNGGSVIVHATFAKEENRTRICQLAQELNAQLHVVYVECEESIVKQRTESGIPLEGKGTNGSDLPSVYYIADDSEASWEVCQVINKIFAPVENPDLRIDGSQHSIESMKQLNEYFNGDRTPMLF